MSIKLNRKGVSLSGEERVKEHENYTIIEREFERIEVAVPEARDAKILAAEAKGIAETAEEKSANIQMQISTLVTEGDSSPQAAQASVGNDGTVYPSLKERLDAEQQLAAAQLADVSQNVPAVLSFVFDDGYQEDNLTYSIFKEYGLTCGFAIITDRLLWASKNPSSKYRKYQQEGFSVLSHSATHLPMADGVMTNNQATYEINKSYKDLEDLGFKINGFVTPMSTLHESYLPLIKENYRYSFTKFTGNLPASNVGHVLKDADVYKLGRVSLLNNSIEKIKASIDNVVKEKGFLAFYEHRTGHPDWISEAKLREVIAYVKQKVDAGLCLVLNPDEAVTQYFGRVGNNKETQNLIGANISPLLNDVGTTAADYSTWYFSRHQATQGELMIPASDSITYAEVQYPNGATAGTIDSVQTKVYLSSLDKNKAKNKSIYFSQEMYGLGDLSNIEVEMRCRFIQADGTFSRTHIVPVLISENKLKYEATFTMLDEADLTAEHALIYTQFLAKAAIPSSAKIRISNPVLGIGVKSNENTVKKNKPFAINLNTDVSVGTHLGNRIWKHYTSPDSNSFIKGLSDGTGTLLIKESGLYSFNLNFCLEVARVTQTLYPRMMLEVSTAKSFGSDTSSRTYTYFRMPDDTFSVVSGYQLWLNGGEKLSIKLWFDSLDGTCIEKMGSVCRIIKLI